MRRIAHVLLIATLVAIPIEDVWDLPGVGTLARVLGLLAFGAWALSVLASGRTRAPDTFHAFAFGLVVWVGLSLFWSLDTNATLERIETFLQLLALSIVIWDICVTERMVGAALQALVFGLSVAATSVFVNFARGVEAYYGRFASTGADPNYLSMTLALGMPIAWYLSLRSPNRALRIFNMLYVPVAAVAMGLTGSRGGFVAGFVAIAYILSTVKQLRPAGLGGLLVVIGLAITTILLIVPETTFERMGSVGDEITEGDLNGRVGIWLEARDAFVQRPLFGIGAGATRAVLPTGKVGHNVAITMGLELGIVGLLLFGGMVGSAIRAAARGHQPDRPMWFALLAIWGIGSLSLSLEPRKFTWILLTLMALAPQAVRTRVPEGDPTGGVVGQPSSQLVNVSTTTDQLGAVSDWPYELHYGPPR